MQSGGRAIGCARERVGEQMGKKRAGGGAGRRVRMRVGEGVGGPVGEREVVLGKFSLVWSQAIFAGLETQRSRP